MLEAEGDGVEDGGAVWLVVVSGSVPSEVVSRPAGSVRAGGSDRLAGTWSGSKAVTSANAATAETTAAASAHEGASTTTSTTRSHPRARSSRRSHTNTANAHTSKANATNSTAAVITAIRLISYATR